MHISDIRLFLKFTLHYMAWLYAPDSHGTSLLVMTDYLGVNIKTNSFEAQGYILFLMTDCVVSLVKTNILLPIDCEIYVHLTL